MNRGHIKVQVYGTRLGHTTSLGHLRLSESDCITIAAQLAHVMDFQHTQCTCTGHYMEQLWQRVSQNTSAQEKALATIQRAYDLKGGQGWWYKCVYLGCRNEVQQ